jgi:glycosyltransferase involved in cell wall biosynthesis
MKVYIFHYHLNPGGVTRIIDLQIEAIKVAFRDVKICLITGYCSNEKSYRDKGIELIVNSDLNYLADDKGNLFEKFDSILSFFKLTCNTGGILHCHNLNLGKNPLVTLAVSRLAQEGYCIINHMHDFSEDRPENQDFLKSIIENIFNESVQEALYPAVENYFFAVLNSFDFGRLAKFGIGEHRRFLLPNPVFLSHKTIKSQVNSEREFITNQLEIDSSKLLVTYPVRVIHRKNIAEFILLAAMFGQVANWMVTQPPQNPKEITEYNSWKEFCIRENIAICWEAGTKVDFEQLVQVSDFCITTSIREGFGMVFLEPWLLDTPVIGRDLLMVTSDLKNSGISYPMLYQKLYIDEQLEIFELSINEQMNVIVKLINSSVFRDKLLDINPFLKEFLKPVDKALIHKNKGVILNEYSLKKYGQKLHEIYRRIIKQS